MADTKDDFMSALASVPDGCWVIPGWDARRVMRALAHPKEAEPLTEGRINALSAVYMHDKSVPFARMVEKACAEAWGVKLAGVGASTKEGGNV